MVHLLPHWNFEGQEGETITVYAFTNGDAVELFQNGQSLGIRRNRPSRVEYQQWDVVYRPGSLKAVASKGGNEIAIKEIRTTGKPAKLELSARREEVSANGEDLLYVECAILDAEGNVVPNADNELSFQVNGEASLVATGNGNPFDQTQFQSSIRSAFKGRCLVIARTTKVEGRVVVKVSAKGLKGATLEVASRN